VTKELTMTQTPQIDRILVEQITRTLLGQYYNIGGIDAALEGETWLVTAEISIFGMKDIRKLRIDANTGEILGWSN
jgi:hypothetical protein